MLNKSTLSQAKLSRTVFMTIIMMVMSLFSTVYGQYAGTISVPSTNFPTLKAAIDSLNTYGVSGNTTVNVTAGYTETLTAKLNLTATGTSSASITIQKSGSGANPKLIAYTGTFATPAITADGMLNLVGSDYVTIDGIDFQDPTANTTTTTVMEYAIALVKASATNGCQFNTIKNCTITLNRIQNGVWTAPGHNGSTGIAVLNTLASTAGVVTVTSAAGSNSFNKFQNNTIQNCNAGIVFIGFAATTGVGPNPSASTFLGDMNNEVGGSASTGNTILNFGGAASAANPATGIFANHQWGMRITNNIVNNNNGSGVNHVSTLRGIFMNSSSTSANVTCNSNIITMIGGGTTAQVTGIESSFGATAANNSININNNVITGGYLTATTGVYYGIYHTAGTPDTLNILNNKVHNVSYSSSTLTGSGVVYPIFVATAPNVVNIIGDTILNITRTGTTGSTTIGIFSSASTPLQIVKKNIVDGLTISGTGATSTMYGIQTSTGTVLVDSNVVTNLNVNKSTGTSALYGIYNIASPTNENINYNKVSNLTHLGTGVTYGIYHNSVAGVRQTSFNTISNISSGSTLVGGMLHTSSTPTIFNNNVFNISTRNASGTAFGIRVSSVGSGTATLYNNFVSDIMAKSSTSNNAVIGIDISGTTVPANIYYNTVKLDTAGFPLTSTGANFGGTGINLGSSSAAFNLANNIVNVKGTYNGTGSFAAIRRLGVAGSVNVAPTNITMSNNIFSVDSAAYNFLYVEGTTGPAGFATAASLRNGYATRGITNDPTNNIYNDASFNSPCGLFKTWKACPSCFFENNLSAGSIAGTYVPTTSSLAKSSATTSTTPTIGFDFSGTTRTSTPDMGALQFSSSASDLSGPTITDFNIDDLNCVAAPSISVEIVDPSGVNSSTGSKPRLYYKLSTENNDSVTNNSSGNGWKFIEASNSTSPFTFNLDFSKFSSSAAVGSIIQYFVVAQDNLSSPNVGNGTLTFNSGYCPASVAIRQAGFPVSGYKSFTIQSPSIEVTASPSTVCINNNDTIVATISRLENVTIGAVTASQASISPYNTTVVGAGRRQISVYRAAELQAQGIGAGPITAISYNVASSTSTLTLPDFTIKMGYHASNSTTVVAGTISSNINTSSMTTVIDYSVSPLSGYTPVVGINTHDFTTPFYWDGVSNIVVETCMSSPSSSTLSTHAVNYTNLGSITMYNTAAGSNCASTATGTVNAFRPVLVFKGTKNVTSGLNYVWKQGTTNLSMNNDTIIVQPSFPGGVTTMKYDAAVTDANGCVFYDTVTISKNTSTPSLVSWNMSNTTPCFGDSIQLSSSVTGGCPPYTVTYKLATTLGGATSNIALSTTSRFFPTVEKGYVSVTIIDNASNTINAFIDSFIMPTIPTPIHDTICGTGTASLNVSGAGITNVAWYNKADLKIPVQTTGTAFTTPVISQTDTFYAATINSMTSVSGGKLTPASPLNLTAGPRGIFIRAKKQLTIDSIGVYVGTTTGTATIQLFDSTGTTAIGSSVTITTTTASTFEMFYVNINVPSAGVYKLMVLATPSTSLIYESTGASYPYPVGNFLDIIASSTANPSGVLSATTYYYFFKLTTTEICQSQKVPVIANVTSPPTLTLSSTGPIQICNPNTNQSFDSVKITSPIGNYSSYSWNPTTVSGNSTVGWAFQSTSSSQDTFTLTAVNAGTGCQQIAKVFVNPVPYSFSKTTTVNLSSHCLSGSSILTLSGSPTLGATYQWQSSPNGSTWNNISGANSNVLNTGTITNTTNYRAIINCNGSPIGAAISPSQTINVTVQNPIVDSFKNDTICGIKSATLRAYTTAPNRIQWYTKTGNFIDTGNVLTTPVLAQTDTFIAKSVTAPGAATSLFTTPTPTGTWTTNNGTNGLMFDLLPNINITIDSFLARIVATTTQTVNVYYKIGTYAGFETNASAWTLFGGTSITAPYNANNGGYLEIALPNGGLSLNAGQTYGIFVSYPGAYVTGTTAPPNNVYSNSDLSFTAGAAVPGTFASFLAPRVFTGKIVYKTGCASAGTPVIVKMNNPPALTFANDIDSVCKGQTTAVKTLSAGGGATYDTYTWSSIPSTAITPSGTISSTGVTFADTTPGLVKYVLTANQTSGALCRNIDTFYLKVKSIPGAFNISPVGPLSVCNGTISQLEASSGYSTNSKIGSGTTNGTAAYYNPFYSTFENEKSHYLFTASELNAAGFQAGNIDSIAFFVTAQAMTYDITSLSVKMAHSNNANLTSGFGTPSGAFTTVFPASNIGKPAVGMFRLPFTTSFNWDGTSNILIEICKDNDPTNSGTFWGGSMAIEYTAYSSAYTYGSYADNTSQCAVGGGTNNSSLNRPNIHFWANTKSPITWSAMSGLFSNSNATAAYAGTPRDTIWSKPNDTTKYFATATHSNGCTLKDSININVLDTLTISQQPPANLTYCVGDTIRIIAQASSTSPISKQWRKNGINISSSANPSAITDTLIIVANSIADSGVYVIQYTTGTLCGSKLSQTSVVKIKSPISITTQPVSTSSVCQGNSYNVSVTAQNATGYQWQKGGSNVTNGSGATNSSFTINPVAVADAGNYTVVINGISPCPSVTSSVNVLSVTPLAAITSQPTAQTVCQGSTLSFSAAASNASSYQWLFNGNPISGANSATYSKSNAQAADSGNYRVVAISAGGCKSDTSVTIVGAVIPAINITTQPVSTSTVCQGNSYNVSVTAQNATGYQWQKGGSNVTNGSGATSSSFTINPVAVADAGNYTVVISGISPCPSVTSSVNVLSVTPLAAITSQPTAQTVCQGSTLSFSAAASNASSYQWLFNGNPISGANSATYSKSNAQAADSGNYRVVAISAGGCKSDTSVTIVGAVIPAINITTQPVSTSTVCQGNSYNVSVTAQNATGYQWQKGGSNVTNGSGATSSSFTINPVAVADAGNYTVVISGISPCPSVTSSVNVLSVTPLAAITTQPTAQTVCQGSTLSFSAAASNASSYQWLFNGNPISGANSATYSKSNAQAADSGNYRVVAISAGGCKSDTSVSIVGAVIPAINITTQPVSTSSVCQGNSYNVSVTAQNATGYQWQKGGSNVTNGSGATSSSFTINPVAVADAGNYTVVISGISPCPSVTSSVNVLSVTPLAAITTQPTAQTVCQGSTLSFSAAASNASSYQWLFNGNPISGANSATYSKSNAQAADSGNYRVVAISAGGCKSDTSVTIVGAVIPAISIITQPPSLAYGCIGSNFNISINASNVTAYNWLRNGTAIGQTTNGVNVNPFTINDTGTYLVVMNGISPCPSVTSSTTHVPHTSAATITTEPQNTDVCLGTNLTLTVSAQAAQSYQWKKDGLDISGATNSSYSIGNISHTDSGIYSVVAIAFNGCINDTSVGAKVSVKTPISITSQPSSTTSLCENTQYTVSITGQNITSYQWLKGGSNATNGTGATSSSFSINPLLTTDAGNYSVLLTGIAPCPNVTSNVNVLSVTPLAKITTQPEDENLCQGGNLNLSMGASNAIGYQWYQNGNLISGANATSYTKSNVQLTDTGMYKVIVLSANGCKSDTSVDAHLMVNIPLSFTNTLPKAITICEGQTISFTSGVLGTGPYTYQWTRNGTTVGSNNSNYFKSSNTIVDAGLYIVNVEGNIACPSINDSSLVVINQSPVITQQPNGSSPICLGDSLILTVNASNVSVIEWHKQGTGFTGITGPRYSKLSTATDGGNYFVIAKPLPACTSTSSSSQSIAVHLPVNILANPLAASLVKFSGYTMSVAVAGTGPFGYQWRKDGINIAGANNSLYTISSYIEAIHQGSYDCVVTSGEPCNSSDTSATAMITTSKCPSIVKQKSSGLIVCSGESVNLEVEALGASGYQWLKDGQPIVGANSRNYSITDANTTNSGTYLLQILGPSTATCPDLFSDPFKVQVADKPQINKEPASNTACSPTSHTMFVSAQNTNSYQWYKNGQPIAGATDSFYKVSSVNTSGDNYYVEAKNALCPIKAVSKIVLVKIVNPSAQVKLASKSIFDLEERCTDENGWTYYAPTAQSDELLLAIKKGGNKVIAKPDIEVLSNIREISPINVENRGAILGSRLFNLDFQSQVLKAYQVKFFYAQSEEDAVMNRFKEIRNIAGKYFSTNRTDSIHFITSTQKPFTSNLRNNLTIPFNIENTIAQTDREFGIENGVKYVIIKSLIATRSGGTLFMDYTLKSNSSIANMKGLDLGISIYPVPSSDGIVNVDVQSSVIKPISFVVYDMMGRAVARFEEKHLKNESSHQFDFSALSNGNYQLEISNEKDKLIGKFTIAK